MASRQAREIAARVGAELRTAREDAGLSLGRVALAAGLSKSRLHDIESGTCQPRWETIARVSAVLGMRLSVGLYPGTGPVIRDHLQAAMISALIEMRHERWRPRLEVAVYRPVRGVIDLVLDETAGDTLVSCEAHSELRRIDQQLRWARAKSDALRAATREGREGRPAGRVSQLLLLRSTTRTRTIVAEHAPLVAAAYPARTERAYAALTGSAPWPGDALLWCRVEEGTASILERPPRGITVGR